MFLLTNILLPLANDNGSRSTVDGAGAGRLAAYTKNQDEPCGLGVDELGFSVAAGARSWNL
jgi:hypothetical protein